MPARNLLHFSSNLTFYLRITFRIFELIFNFLLCHHCIIFKLYSLINKINKTYNKENRTYLYTQIYNNIANCGESLIKCNIIKCKKKSNFFSYSHKHNNAYNYHHCN